MKDLITFTGGLDFDSDIRNVGEVDYIDALNISSGTSQRGSVHNMYGNKLQDYTLPTGENTCIGTLRNIKQNTIIYFVYNSLGNHSILEYSCAFKVIEPILAPFNLFGINFTTNFLGFTKENKIHSANILDDILTWTDNNVSPRKINKKRAYDFMRQLPPSATNIPYDNLIATGTNLQKIQFIEFIKYKPDAQPSIGTGFDPTKATNYIREKMIQAKYRYIYDDNEYSRWSDGSWVTLPDGSENVNGPISNSSANNYVIVTLNTGHPTVKAIDIAFRDGNTGIWAKIDTPIKKYDQDNQRLIDDFINYEYNFYGDNVLIEIADDLDNYDSVPQLSKTQEIIDGNRQVFANNVEGYQNPTPEVAMDYENTIYKISTPDLLLTYGGATSDQTDFRYSTELVYSLYPKARLSFPVSSAGPPSYLVVGTVLTFKLVRSDSPTFIPGPGQYREEYQITYTVIEEDLTQFWPRPFMNRVRSAIELQAFPVGKIKIEANYMTVGMEPYNNGEYTAIIQPAKFIFPSEKKTSLKKGAFHAFGIVYKDKQGRDGGVLTDSTFSLYNPYLPEIHPGETNLVYDAYISKALMTISHKPPIWAYTYEIVYALNNLNKYTQFVLKDHIPAVNTQGNYDIDCSYIVDYITKQAVGGSVDFQFETGDLIRFISNSPRYCSNYVETKVIAYDSVKNILTVYPYPLIQVVSGLSNSGQGGVVCELFSYKKQASPLNRPFFSIGETYSIANPGTANRTHRANDQNQTASTPAIVKIQTGDTYIYKRFFQTAGLNISVESENFSDFYNSKNINISAVYAVIPEGKTKRYEQGLRYGGRYFPNTNTNNLCQFNGSDYDTVNTRYGPINKIASVGYTLKVLQTKKNTSIYIDRNMIFNANGESQLTLTDKVLGNKNPSELDYGCDHPESVCVDDRQLYFFDVNTGTFIQDSANGMMPISDYKAKTYFRDIAQKIKDSSNVYVYASMDVFNAYVNVTFIDTTGSIIPNQTIAYHTPDNKWKTKLSYTPEYYGSNALTFVSFKDGALWEHNDQTVPRNNFYGTQHSTKVKFVANQDYLTIKNYASVAIYSNKLWSSPNIGDIKVPASTGYPIGMESRLLSAKFRWKESVAYADYLRDANTPNFPTQEAALMGGRKLRGQVLIQEIENSDTDETVLYSVLVNSVASPLSK